MAKYSIDVLGNIIVGKNEVSKEKVLNDIIRLPNKSNKINTETNKFSELNRGGGFITTENIFSNADGNKNKDSINRVVNTTDKLRNESFGFDSNPDREITFYNSYNSVFDLNLDNFDNQNIKSVQIFAENLDFYGFPLILKDIAEFTGDELPVRLFTLIDTIVASFVPIAAITTLQFLLQENESNSSSLIPVLFGEDINKKQNENENIYELGSYIKYEKSEDFNLVYDVLKKTLQSFERLMNYPRFALPSPPPPPEGGFFAKAEYVLKLALFLIQNIARNLIYFVQGYIFYLNPGLKTKFTLEFNQLTLASLFDLITSFITTDSSRHIYNLLIRKILRNNYFLNQIVNSDARKQANSGTNLNSTLSFLSSFFFRFVGERISVGEKLIKTDSMELKNKDNVFFQSRYSEFSSIKSPKKSTLSIGNIIVPDAKDPYVFLNQVSFSHSSNYPYRKKNAAIRLRRDDVKFIEQAINLDYMPFSIQDLRTNEIFKFHAFIDSITDSYSANYNEMGGYGRSEKIKIYSNTTRSINVSFKIAAMSPEDHDHMWYLINRLVMMIYPQWSKGVPARDYLTNDIKTSAGLSNSDISKYSLPFTQLPSNSPMVRLRVGDIIASNYSVHTVSKLFGFEKKINKKEEEISNKEEEKKPLIESSQSINEIIEEISLLDTTSDLLKKDLIDQQRKLELRKKRDNPRLIIKAEKEISNIQNEIKSIENQSLEKKIKINKILKNEIELLEKEAIVNSKNAFSLEKTIDKHPDQFPPGQPVYNEYIKLKNKNKELIKKIDEKVKLQSDFLNSQNLNVEEINLNNPNPAENAVANQNQQKSVEQAKQQPEEKKGIDKKFLLGFMQAEKTENGETLVNNPIVKAFESNMGSGLAGFITSFGIDWDQGSFWEIKKGNRAPKIATITIGFAPSHDIPLGLDHKGNLRAVAYPVGSDRSVSRGTYMNNSTIDYDKDQLQEETKYEFEFDVLKNIKRDLEIERANSNSPLGPQS